MRKYMSVLLALILFFCLVQVAGAASGDHESPLGEPDLYRAVILKIEKAEDDMVTTAWATGGKLSVLVRLTEGPYKGQEMTIDHYLTGNPAYDLNLKPGDRVFVGVEAIAGYVVDSFIAEYVRDNYLYLLALLFVASLVLVGGVKGAKAAIVLVLTGLAVAYVMVPLLLSGTSPVLASLLVSALVVCVGLVFISGPNAKTAAASAGTVAGVVVAGVIAVIFGILSNLIGMNSHEAQLLYFVPDLKIDFRGLLFSGMILGSLGAVMDVGMSISSAVWEVKAAKPDAGMRQLVRSGMNVGRDVLGTMSNTLILAYAGGALPLILLSVVYDIPLQKLMNLDVIATEVVRALAGSIGLVFCVPATALACGYLYRRAHGTGDKVPTVAR
ncbi:MAG: YibE/F family protein [Bacillota bacterium]